VKTMSEPRPRKWTRKDYHTMADVGLFDGQRVELVEGEVVEMSPQSPEHYGSIERIASLIRKVFGSSYWVRTQGPLILPNNSEPEPDISVVTGGMNDYDDHPRGAVLVIEISGTTLRHDRERKKPLYARAGIEEYWIVNLFEQQLEVYRQPRRIGSRGWNYESQTNYRRGDSVSPLALPKARIAVSDLFLKK
jgi:Uma2 family endonuclease